MRKLDSARHSLGASAGGLRRGHYELRMQSPVKQRLVDAFDELALAI
jgi:hypothetical protein